MILAPSSVIFNTQNTWARRQRCAQAFLVIISQINSWFQEVNERSGKFANAF
jgi:hypothetical protein